MSMKALDIPKENEELAVKFGAQLLALLLTHQVDRRASEVQLWDLSCRMKGDEIPSLPLCGYLESSQRSRLCSVSSQFLRCFKVYEGFEDSSPHLSQCSSNN